MTDTGLVWLVSSWFRLLGTLPLRGLLRRSEVRSGDRELDRLGVLWDLYLSVNRLGERPGARSEGRAREGFGFGGLAFGILSGYLNNRNRHNC